MLSFWSLYLVVFLSFNVVFIAALFGGNGKPSRRLFEPMQTFLSIAFALFMLFGVIAMWALTLWETLINGHPIMSVAVVLVGTLPLLPIIPTIERLCNAIPLVLFHMPMTFLLSQPCVPTFFKAITGDRGFARRAEEHAAELRAQAVDLLNEGEL